MTNKNTKLIDLLDVRAALLHSKLRGASALLETYNPNNINARVGVGELVGGLAKEAGEISSLLDLIKMKKVDMNFEIKGDSLGWFDEYQSAILALRDHGNSSK